MSAEPLIINNWAEGIGTSPYGGNGVLRNVDIESFPGALKARAASLTQFHTALAATFTADAGTDVCTTAGAVPVTGSPVRLTTTGTLPAGLATGTDYYIIKVSGTTFKLASTWTLANAGTAIDITDAGTGVHTVTTTDPGTIKHFASIPGGKIYAIDSNGRVWVRYLDTIFILVKGNTLTNGSGNGLIPFQASNGTQYLFVFRNALIDVLLANSGDIGTPTWTSGWQTMNTGGSTANSHQGLLGQDGVAYYVDDHYVGSIAEAVGSAFDPSNAATYTFSQDALDLPLGEVAEWVEEQGIYLMIAGGVFDKIYPWDRVSDSFASPIIVPEWNVRRLKTIGPKMYILAGSKGNVYSTTGIYVALETTLPRQVVNNAGTLQIDEVTWGGIAARNGNLIFGASVITSGNSGVFMLYPDKRLVIDNMPSTGSANVTALLSRGTFSTTLGLANEFYFLGYAGGADIIGTTRYSSFQGVYHSQFYEVATKTEKGQFSTIECVITKPAASGNVRIGYRTDASSSFTTLATFTADGSTTTFEQDIGLTDLENIQIQVEIDGLMELKTIRLFP